MIIYFNYSIFFLSAFVDCLAFIWGFILSFFLGFTVSHFEKTKPYELPAVFQFGKG